MNNVPYDVGRTLIDFNINRCVMGRASPKVERKQHCNCDGRWQLLRLSAAAVFILPCVARMQARAPIVAEVRCMLLLQEVP